MNARKKVIVLGSTGSIGLSTLDVVREHPDALQVVGLSAHTNEDSLLRQMHELDVEVAALTGRPPAQSEIQFHGPRAVSRMLEQTEADIVVNGIAGAEGLAPSVAALSAGKDLALANKETIVMAGPLVKGIAERAGRSILPVDSEHSAIFHLMASRGHEVVDRIILTASGGAFRDRPVAELAEVTWRDALAHPTWDMGRKITIDSATMANKGLELIEAQLLFDVPIDRIDVLIHPQSIVHSLIRTIEGSLYSQMSSPDMRLPIQNALSYPEIWGSPYGALDLAETPLVFRKPDTEKYRCLELARRAGTLGHAYPAAYNAANEVAVDAFLQERIGFLDIPNLIENCLEADWRYLLGSLELVYETDRKARSLALSRLESLT